MHLNVEEQGVLFPMGPPFDTGPKPDDPIILSRERFSLRQGRPYASAIFDQFPNAKIICIIREQRDLLRTLYIWLIAKRFLLVSLNRFIQNLDKNDYEDLLYHDEVVDEYARNFGRDNLLVLPYEILKADPKRFHDTLSTFCGIDYSPILSFKKRNPTYKRKATIRAYKVFNFFVRIGVLVPLECAELLVLRKHWPERKPQIIKKIHRFSRRRIGLFVEGLCTSSEFLKVESSDIAKLLPSIIASNDRLSQWCDFDLHSLGYLTTRNVEDELGQPRN